MFGWRCLIFVLLFFKLNIDGFVHRKNSLKGLARQIRNRDGQIFSLESDDQKIPTLSSEENTVKDNTIWFDLRPFVDKISLPNIFSGFVLGGLVAMLTLLGTVFVDFDPTYTDSSLSGDSTSIQKPVTLFEDILIDLKQGYVDDINTNTLFESAVSGMLKTLDPYTEFENLKSAQNFQESVSGKYGGVGMVISGTKPIEATSNFPAKSNGAQNIIAKEANGVSVVDAFEGYSFDANVRVGDRILAVNGEDTTKMNVEEVRNLLRGDPGSDVLLLLEREEASPASLSDSETLVTPVTVGEKGKSIYTVKISRQQVRMSDVRLATFLGPPEDGIGYITLSGTKVFVTFYLSCGYVYFLTDVGTIACNDFNAEIEKS